MKITTVRCIVFALTASPSLAFIVTRRDDDGTVSLTQPQRRLPQTEPSRFASSVDDVSKNDEQFQWFPFYRRNKHFLESSLFVTAPFYAGALSFFLYPGTSVSFHNTVNYLSNNNWEPVDGGQLQWSILLPALNGVVMTAISLLYANLISVTGTQLRNRQGAIHQSLSAEVEGIRDLAQLIRFYPDSFRQDFGQHLKDYVHLVVQEVDSRQQNVDQLSSLNQPLSDYREDLHFLSVQETDPINVNILDRSYETLQNICDQRRARITSLQTVFPPLHYVTISVLTAVILLVFLLETDRKVILFLDKFQIRLVWSLLVGTLTAIYCIGIDLANPFIGTYTVPAEQFLDESDEILQLISETMASSDPSFNNLERESSGWAEPADTGDHEVAVHHRSKDPEPALSLYEEYMRGRTMGQ